MYTLYIDTHFVQLNLALFYQDEVVEEIKIDSQKHAENTISLLEQLLKNRGLDVHEINSIIVISGPGSFTGVRLGIVIAKMLGLTLDIPIKSITYLEAMALTYHEPVIVGIKDRNGAFVGEFNELHELIRDYYYLSNQELEKVSKKIMFDDCVDLNKIKNYVLDKDSISPHLLKPLYVKKIEVEK